MNSNFIYRTGTIEVLKLLSILALAYCLNFIPHVNYFYPIHHDEWMHMAYSEAIIQEGAITFFDPFYGQFIKNINNNLEIGTHIFLALFQMTTNMPWSTVFTFLPGIIFMITVLSVYIVAQREGFGLEAAFFTCLIPTSVGILGPAFLVPVTFGLLFIPLCLFVAFNIKSWHGYLILFLLSSILFLIHPPTAIILGVILIPYILLNLINNFKHGLAVVIAVVGPFLISIPWTWKTVLSTTHLLFSPQMPSPYVTLPPVLQIYGYLPLIISLVGIVWIVIRGGKNNISFLFGLLALLLLLFTFYRLHIGLPIIYQRGLVIFTLLLSIVAGAGLFCIKNMRLSDTHVAQIPSFLTKNIGAVLCSSLVIIALFFSIRSHVNTSYYHMIEQEDYEAFIWVRDNIGKDYSTALLDPWKATAFTAITQKHVLHRIFLQQEPADNTIYQFLMDGCPSTAFIKDNGISVIYSQLPCSNPDLMEVRNNVFIINYDSLLARGTLRNSGFEAITEGPPKGWYSWSRNCTPVFLYPESGREWGNCVGINVLETKEAESWPEATWSAQDRPAEAGKSYYIGGWLKTENIAGRGGARIVVNWYDQSGAWIVSAEFMRYTRNTQDWTFYEGVVKAPVNAANCRISCSVAGCLGTAWFDDIIFKKTETKQ